MNETTYGILKMIMAGGERISGDAIGAALNISRNAVNKHVNKLKESGINIESGKRGYKYIESDSLSEYTLRYKFEKSGLPFKVFVASCDSTNNYAKALASEKPFIVAAPYQTHGKGRISRKFSSKEGGVYVTFAVAPKNLSVANSLNLVLMCGIAVKNTLSAFGISAGIKWPNDILINGKKICGILLESTLDGERIENLYLGIGINVNNDISEVSDVAVNMSQLLGNGIAREDVLLTLAKQVDSLLSEYESSGFDRQRDEYIAASCTIGKKVTISSGDGAVSGLAQGLSPYGYLIIEDENGQTREITVGDILPYIGNVD